MKIVIKLGGFLFALLLLGLTWAEGTELVYTRAAFNKNIKTGFTLVYVYTLDKPDQDETELPDGSWGHTDQWHAVDHIDRLLNKLCAASDYADLLSCIRVNLARGDLASLRAKYQLTGDSILLFMEGIQVGKNILITPDFKLSDLKKTAGWLKLDDFIEQERVDRKKVEQQRAARDRERRRAYSSHYYYAPRPYVGFGWGGGYYEPGWGWGASPYVGFGFSL